MELERKMYVLICSDLIDNFGTVRNGFSIYKWQTLAECVASNFQVPCNFSQSFMPVIA